MYPKSVTVKPPGDYINREKKKKSQKGRFQLGFLRGAYSCNIHRKISSTGRSLPASRGSSSKGAEHHEQPESSAMNSPRKPAAERRHGCLSILVPDGEQHWCPAGWWSPRTINAHWRGHRNMTSSSQRSWGLVQPCREWMVMVYLCVLSIDR